MDTPKPTKKTPQKWSWAAKPPNPPAEWDQLLETRSQSKDKLVKASRTAFQRLMTRHLTAKTIDKPEMEVFTGFLSSARDEPAAMNTRTLLHWLAGRAVSADAWQAFTALLCDKIQLGSLDDAELRTVIRALRRAVPWEQDDSACQHLHEMLITISTKLNMRAEPDRACNQALFEVFYQTTRNAQACSGLVNMLSRTISDQNLIQTMRRSVSMTFSSILTFSSEDEDQTRLLSQLCDVLGTLREDVHIKLLNAATKDIFATLNADYTPQDIALKWLQCLSTRSSFVQSPEQSDAVYAELAKFLMPSQIAKHFTEQRVPALDMARMLLRTWFPNADLKKLRNMYPKCVITTTSKENKHVRIFRHGLLDLTKVQWPEVTQEFERLFTDLVDRRRRYNTWVLFLRALARMGVSYEAIVHEVLALSNARHAPGTTAQTFKIMRQSMAMPSSVAVPLINHFLATDRPRHAVRVFLDEPSVAITDCPGLPIACMNDRGAKINLFDFLIRQREIVSRGRRTIKKLTLAQSQIDVVHLIAHDIAHAPSVSDREAFRNAWACYRYLRDRSAPLTPLISRAIVHAGISRPLQSRTWVPEKRLEFIFDIVEKIEGPEMREPVEELARYMRSSMHDEVLARRAAQTQSAWLNQTAAMREQTQFQAKVWTKRKPMLTPEGRSYWVPVHKAKQEHEHDMFEPVDQDHAGSPAEWEAASLDEPIELDTKAELKHEHEQTQEQRSPVRKTKSEPWRLRKLLRNRPAEEQQPALAEHTPLDTLMTALHEGGEDTPSASCEPGEVTSMVPNEPSEDKSKE